MDGQSQPWNYVNGGLNTNFQFGTNGGLTPTIVSGADGFDFSPGGTFVITYVSGATSFHGSANYDGSGATNTVPTNNNPDPNNGIYYPSYYVDPAAYPVYLSTLIGTFADSSGSIVGTPFAIKNGPYNVIVPNGATRLQMGINDDYYQDNSGSLTVSVNGPAVAAVPEPGSVAMVIGINITGALVILRRLRRRKQV